MRLVVTLQRDGPTSVAELRGPLLIKDDADELRRKILLLFNENRFNVLLNMGNCYSMSVEGVNVIRELQQEATKRAGVCLLYSACASVLEVLEKDSAIDVFPNHSDALASVNGNQVPG